MGKKVTVLLISILLLAGLLRFFSLDKIPPGFLPEEVSNGWNAYSILKTGKDEWGNFLPLTFRESGSYRLPLASFIMIPFIATLKLNHLSIRIPVAAASTLAVFLVYLIAFKLLSSRKIALTAALLLAISPWSISIARYGMEVSFGLVFFLAGLYFFLNFPQQTKRLVFSSIFFGISYYAYQSYVIFTSLFILGLILIFPHIYRGKKLLLLFLFIQLIFLLPFIFNKSLSIRYQQTTFINNLGITNRIAEHRQACGQRTPPIVCKMLYNWPLFAGIDKIRNYINHFSTTTFFLYGSQLGLSSMPERWGLLYLFEFPLILIGIFSLIKNKNTSKLFGLWLLVFAIPSSTTSEGHIWRMATLLPLPQMITAAGLIELLHLSKNILLKIGVTGIICFSYLLFLADYFIYFPYAQGAYSYAGFREVYQYLNKIEQNYDYIVIAPTSLGFDQLYIYYLFYNQYDPKLYQLGENIDRKTDKQNWTYVSRIGKWYFVSKLENASFPVTGKTLFVTDGAFKDDLSKFNANLHPELLYTIYYANGDVAFKIIKFNKN